MVLARRADPPQLHVAARLAQRPEGRTERQVRPRRFEVPVGAVPAGGADAVGGLSGLLPRVLMGMGTVLVLVLVGGAVGAGSDGLRVVGFGLGVEAGERGDVDVAAGPAVGLFGAEHLGWIGFGVGCEEGLLLLGREGGDGRQV